MLELASSYIERLTGGIYTFDILRINEGVALVSGNGERLNLSSGLVALAGPSILALRLAPS